MNKTLTLIACSALVLGAIAVPAMAQDDRAERDAPDREDRREAAKERQAEFRAAHAECKEARQNGTLNGTQGACVSEAAHAKHDPAHQARRAYHHIEKQIDAVEHRIAKLEVKEYRLEAALASGDLNATESEHANATLERIEHAQGDLVEELRELYQKLKDLKERWDGKDDRVRPYPRDAPETDDSD